MAHDPMCESPFHVAIFEYKSNSKTQLYQIHKIFYQNRKKNFKNLKLKILKMEISRDHIKTEQEIELALAILAEMIPTPILEEAKRNSFDDAELILAAALNYIQSLQYCLADI